jgi:hypothetical protein
MDSIPPPNRIERAFFWDAHGDLAQLFNSKLKPIESLRRELVSQTENEELRKSLNFQNFWGEKGVMTSLEKYKTAYEKVFEKTETMKTKISIDKTSLICQMMKDCGDLIEFQCNRSPSAEQKRLMKSKWVVFQKIESARVLLAHECERHREKIVANRVENPKFLKLKELCEQNCKNATFESFWKGTMRVGYLQFERVGKLPDEEQSPKIKKSNPLDNEIISDLYLLLEWMRDQVSDSYFGDPNLISTDRARKALKRISTDQAMKTSLKSKNFWPKWTRNVLDLNRSACTLL